VPETIFVVANEASNINVEIVFGHAGHRHFAGSRAVNRDSVRHTWQLLGGSVLGLLYQDQFGLITCVGLVAAGT